MFTRSSLSCLLTFYGIPIFHTFWIFIYLLYCSLANIWPLTYTMMIRVDSLRLVNDIELREYQTWKQNCTIFKTWTLSYCLCNCNTCMLRRRVNMFSSGFLRKIMLRNSTFKNHTISIGHITHLQGESKKGVQSEMNFRKSMYRIPIMEIMAKWKNKYWIFYWWIAKLKGTKNEWPQYPLTLWAL